jgi:putative hemolysin
VEHGFSRIPVYAENLDRIKGIIYIKDLLTVYGFWALILPGHKLLREPFYVPESKKIDDLFTEFQEMKMHLAMCGG